MSPRVTSDLLLVGSIPAASAEDALRAAAVNFAGPGLVFALPDGETGPPGVRFQVGCRSRSAR